MPRQATVERNLVGKHRERSVGRRRHRLFQRNRSRTVTSPPELSTRYQSTRSSYAREKESAKKSTGNSQERLELEWKSNQAATVATASTRRNSISPYFDGVETDDMNGEQLDSEDGMQHKHGIGIKQGGTGNPAQKKVEESLVWCSCKAAKVLLLRKKVPSPSPLQTVWSCLLVKKGATYFDTCYMDSLLVSQPRGAFVAFNVNEVADRKAVGEL